MGDLAQDCNELQEERALAAMRPSCSTHRWRSRVSGRMCQQQFPRALLRQLLAFRNGVRVNEQSPQMNPVVEKLTLEEMIDIVAYVSSQYP